MTFEPGRLGQSRSDLAEALRGERLRAGKTQTWLARRCNMSQTKVSNIEGGRLTPSLVDVELMLDALGVDGPFAARVSALARTAHTEWQDHWSSPCPSRVPCFVVHVVATRTLTASLA
ncbi:helix-turn-helix domain-containing protein [Streptomyces sp. NPDC059578]|uniref:helix-turn-helix domain-containing protein n=1 Tax=unclassified Streptomyces TaxID=2593676 RepID=UPI00364D2759